MPMSTLARSILALCFTAPLCAAAEAATVRLELDNYFVYVGDPHTDYFNGKLLTAKDLSDEQSYQRSSDRYIGESTTPLLERFVAAGKGSVTLLLDEADALFSERTEVDDAHDRYDENFIVLDESSGTWHGRLYLDAFGTISSGIYDDLTGHFDDFQAVPLPAMAGPFVLAVACMWAGKRHERRTERRV